ncbi:MAG: DNA repair protein RecO [Dehalococcoidia bacterium]|nr:DNA repair protein RecO [Dehalococcoidia bacterium]
MPRPRIYKTEAIVLRKTNLAEADGILTLYTPNLGKIRATARGIRKPRSRLAGHLDPLSRSVMLIARGRSLDIITQSEMLESFPSLRQDLRHIACAIYIAELVDKFTIEEAENYGIYILLTDSLRRLGETRDPDMLLRCFELRLLGLAGYQPQVFQCPGCGSSLNPVRNLFSPAAGGVLCPVCGARESAARPISVDALKVMRFLLSNNQDSIERLRVPRELATEIKYLIRAYIRYTLEHDLKSVEFLEDLERTR